MATEIQTLASAVTEPMHWCRREPVCTGVCAEAREAFEKKNCAASDGCPPARHCAAANRCQNSIGCYEAEACKGTPRCENLNVIDSAKPKGQACKEVRNCVSTLSCKDASNECSKAQACMQAQANCARGMDWSGLASIRQDKNLHPTVPSIGLAFSGGGIRSATFNLGILQGLQQLGLLRYMQYLSTVSGGGYIGSFLVSAYQRAGERSAKPDEDPHELQALLATSPEIRHLRQFSRYLAPQPGLMSADTWTILTTWFRNTILIQFEVIVSLALVLLAPRAVHGLAAIVDGGMSESPAVWLTSAFFGVVVLFAGLQYVLGQLALVYRRGAGHRSQRIVMRGAVPVLGAAFLGAFSIWPMVLHERTLVHQLFMFNTFEAVWRHTQPWDLAAHIFPVIAMVGFCSYLTIKLCKIGAGSTPTWVRWLAALIPGVLGGTAFVGLAAVPEVMDMQGRAFAAQWGLTAWWPLIGPSMVLITFSMMLILVLGIIGRDMQDSQREWWSRIGAWLLIFASAVLALSVVALQAPPVVVRLWTHWDQWDWFKTIFTGWSASTIGAVVAGNSDKSGVAKNADEKKKTNWRDLLAKSGPFLYVAGLLVGISMVLEWAVVTLAGTLSGRAGDPGNGWELIAAIVLGLLLVLPAAMLSWIRFDLNEFSMHHFYRNRLVRAYMGATNRMRNANFFTGFDFTDDLKMARVVTPVGPTDQTFSGTGSYVGPYPIVNAALNASQGANLDEQDRRARSFVFTPLYCGFDGTRLGESDQTNKLRFGDMPAYRPTVEYIDKSEPGRLGGIKYGTAVAISGAAASPNMGFHTSPAVAFLLTMFNVRLGWWVPNPAKDSWQTPAPQRQLWNLTKELFGSASPRDPYVYVSDGGHFENLGVYELIRRRCKIIIACDAEEDCKYEFQGLAGLIRKCRIDFRVKIEMNVRHLCTQEDGWSRGHIAIGDIAYPDGTAGRLIYIKSSMTGDESEDILQYKKTNDTFPHESTGDQFFSEDQFESYRALGKHIALGCLKDACIGAQIEGLRDLLSKFHIPERQLRNVLDKRTQDNGMQQMKAYLSQLMTPLGATDQDLETLRLGIRELMNSGGFWENFLSELGRPKESLTSAESFTKHSTSLMALWGNMAADPELSYLDSELFPDWRSQSSGGLPGAMSDGAARKAFYHTQQMLQLMENVFMDLDLERNWRKPDNAGWRELFAKWGSSPTLKSAWQQTAGTYSERFQEFCETKQIFK